MIMLTQRVLVCRARRDHGGKPGAARARRSGRRDNARLARLGATTGARGVTAEVQGAFPKLSADFCILRHPLSATEKGHGTGGHAAPSRLDLASSSRPTTARKTDRLTD